MSSTMDLPWHILGDFNYSTLNHEKSGRRTIPNIKFIDLNNLIFEARLRIRLFFYFPQ